MEKDKKKIAVERKNSDEWLCSSSYQPRKEEVIATQPTPRKRKIPKIRVVVPKVIKSTHVSNHVKRVQSSFQDLEVKTPKTKEKLKFKNAENWRQSSGTPKIHKSSEKLPVRSRQSPGEIFASLTPKRRRSSLELVEDLRTEKVNKIEKEKSDEDLMEDEKDPFDYSSPSEVSNFLDAVTPIKNKIEEVDEEFFANFHTAYEYQMTLGNSCCGEKSPDIMEDEENVEDDEGTPEIEVSPEKKATFAVPAMKKVGKRLRFENEERNVEEEQPDWQTENLIDESCAVPVLASMAQEYQSHHYAIDVETQAAFLSGSEAYRVEEETNHHDDIGTCMMTMDQRSKYEKVFEDSSISRRSSEKESAGSQNYEKADIFERDELTGLAAKFASIMATKTSERRLMMNDLSISGKINDQEKLKKFEVKRYVRCFGITILHLDAPNDQTTIISRSSTLRRFGGGGGAIPPLLQNQPLFVCVERGKRRNLEIGGEQGTAHLFSTLSQTISHFLPPQPPPPPLPLQSPPDEKEAESETVCCVFLLGRAAAASAVANKNRNILINPACFVDRIL